MRTDRHRAGEIAHAFDPHKWTKRPSRCREQTANGDRRVHDGCALAHHQIGAALEASRELGYDARWIGEIGLHQQHRIASRIPRVPRDIPRQRVDRSGISHRLRPTQHRDRHGVRVLLGHLGRLVGTGVVVDHDFILARKFGKHRTESPQQDADGGDLVVRGNGKVEQLGRAEGRSRGKGNRWRKVMRPIITEMGLSRVPGALPEPGGVLDESGGC